MRVDLEQQVTLLDHRPRFEDDFGETAGDPCANLRRLGRFEVSGEIHVMRDLANDRPDDGNLGGSGWKRIPGTRYPSQTSTGPGRAAPGGAALRYRPTS